MSIPNFVVLDVGDMLAFAFKAFSTEADLARGLFQYKPDDDERGERKSAGSEDDVLNAAAPESMSDRPMSAIDLLYMSTSGLARPLKSRIIQLVAALARRPGGDDAESDDGLNDDFEEEGAGMRTRITNLYEIGGLLLFYKSVIEKAIQKLDLKGAEVNKDSSVVSPLIACLIDCLEETTQAYEATSRAYGAMLSQIYSVTGETEANQATSMLSLVSEVRLSSPGFSNGLLCPDACATILSLDWVAVTLVDAALFSCSTLDDTLALKQCISDMQKSGLGVVAASKLNESIDEKETELVDLLIETEKQKVLDLCGLGRMASAWDGWQQVTTIDGSPMSAYPGLSQEDAEFGMKSFYASLYSPPLPSLETAVKDPHLRKSARSKIADQICIVYSNLHESMLLHGGYENMSFLAHSPQQVNTLFSA
jgi:hypothetical protein